MKVKIFFPVLVFNKTIIPLTPVRYELMLASAKEKGWGGGGGASVPSPLPQFFENYKELLGVSIRPPPLPPPLQVISP